MKTRKKTVTLRNDYHGTVARVATVDGGRLSQSQVNRIRRRLCGLGGCTCGGNLSERGPQPGLVVDADQDGKVWIWFSERRAMEDGGC